MMWLFSSNAEEGASNETNLVDEESTIDVANKSYSTLHDDGTAPGEMNGGDTTGAAVHSTEAGGGGSGVGPTIIPLPTYQCNGTSDAHNLDPAKPKKQRGIIYFRRIIPSDRKIIQTLHEQWFPVDYKPDFFDTVCNSTQRSKMPGLLNCEPLFSCVACFKELGEEEFELRMKRRRERDEREASWSFWSSKESGGGDDVGMDDEYGDDCLLWETDDPVEGSRADEKAISYQDTASTSDGTDGSVQSQQPQTPSPTPSPAGSDAQGEDVVESGESINSIHHRLERERLERFYSNGYRYDRNNSSPACNNDYTSGENDKDSGGATNSNSGNTHGPYYNDDGEQIVGCVVGTFLSSSMLANRHKSTLDEKPKRDETAQLLVPDCDRHTKMFYIMTLGTTREFRRCGLGSILVDRVVDMIEDRPECGALYLHVITFNEGAIRLYERLGFMRVKEIKDYYTINAVNYDCYLYARYFHGNRGHKSTLGVLYDIASSIIWKLSHAFIST